MAEQLELPLTSWTEGNSVTLESGKTLQRWGDVAEAVIVLGERRWTRKDVYYLLKAHVIHGYQRQPGKKNSKWEVDLWSVWRFKLRGKV